MYKRNIQSIYGGQPCRRSGHGGSSSRHPADDAGLPGASGASQGAIERNDMEAKSIAVSKAQGCCTVCRMRWT